MAEKYKYVTIKDREYQICKFGARDGSFIVTKVSGILAPMVEPLLKGADPKKLASAKSPSDIDLQSLNIGSIFQPLANIPEADFFYLQEKCLGVCRVKLGSGFVDVVNDNGSFAVEELEDDGMAVMALTVHALWFNLASFFAGSPFMGLLNGILATNPPN